MVGLLVLAYYNGFCLYFGLMLWFWTFGLLLSCLLTVVVFVECLLWVALYSYFVGLVVVIFG